MSKRILFTALALVLMLGTLGAGIVSAAPAPNFESIRGLAENYFAGGTKNIKADALYELLHDGDAANDPMIIDVRKAEDFALGHIPGAVNIPAAKLFTAEILATLPTDKQIVLNCYTGQTSSQTVSALNMMGFKAFNLVYGLPGWNMVEGVSTPPFDAAMSKGYDVSTEPATLSGTFEYPVIQAEGANALETLMSAAETYFAGGTKNIKADALYELLHDGDTANDPIMIDVRKAEDYALGHIPGAVNIPVAKLFTAETLAQLPANKQIVVNCYTGQTSSQTVSALNELGYKAFNLVYGLPAWKMVEGVSTAPFNAGMSKGYAVETVAAPAPQTVPAPEPQVMPAPAPQTLPATGAMLPDVTTWFIGGLALLLVGLGLRRATAR